LQLHPCYIIKILKSDLLSFENQKKLIKNLFSSNKPTEIKRLNYLLISVFEEILAHPLMQDIRNVTFETNGTQPLHEKFKKFLEEWYFSKREITFRVSAKLSASGEKWEEAIKPEIVQEYASWGHTYLKFVVETEEHFKEVDLAVKEYRNAGFDGSVYVMPQGGVVTPYAANRVKVADWAVSKGYYYSPRLHVDLWGNGWGK
jgi:hypothetical protein